MSQTQMYQTGGFTNLEDGSYRLKPLVVTFPLSDISTQASRHHRHFDKTQMSRCTVQAGAIVLHQ